MMLARLCYCLRWVEQLGAGLAAAAVNAVVLIWKLAQMDFLTIRENCRLAERHAQTNNSSDQQLRFGGPLQRDAPGITIWSLSP